jgi:hypothetical protein
VAVDAMSHLEAMAAPLLAYTPPVISLQLQPIAHFLFSAAYYTRSLHQVIATCTLFANVVM